MRGHSPIEQYCKGEGLGTAPFYVGIIQCERVASSRETLAIDGTIRNELADLTAVIVTDETVTKAYVHRVVDIAEPVPDNLIHGTHRFRVQGKKMILLADNPPYQKNSYGTRFELVVDDPGDGQNFEAHSAELLEGSDYRLCVPTKAGEDDDVEQCPAKPVKCLKVVDPAPHIDYLHDGAPNPQPDKFVRGSGLIVEGRNLTGASMTLGYTKSGEEKTYEFAPSEYYEDEGRLIAPPDFWEKIDLDTTKPVTVTVTTDKGSDSRATTFREV